MFERRPEVRIFLRDDAGNEQILISYGFYVPMHSGPEPGELKRIVVVELETEDGCHADVLDEKKGRFVIGGVLFREYDREKLPNRSP